MESGRFRTKRRVSGRILFIRFSRYGAWACFVGGSLIGTNKVVKMPRGTCFCVLLCVVRYVCLWLFNLFLFVFLSPGVTKEKNSFFFVCFSLTTGKRGNANPPHHAKIVFLSRERRYYRSTERRRSKLESDRPPGEPGLDKGQQRTQ